MKKLFLLAVAGVLAMGLSLPAMAALDNTAHDQPTTAGGSCALCHLPHGASAAGRLWVTDPVGGGAVNLIGAVSPLCGYCHQNAGIGTAGLTTGYVDPSSTTWVYGDLSHGYMMSSNNDLPRQMAASGLPYHTDAADKRIECTTCHDVHNDPANRRPFLRANITVLCAGCHGNRMGIGGSWQNGTTALALADAGNWGANFVGVNNPGSHPVGDDITGNVYGGASPITIWPSMRVAMTASRDTWSLGGHLSINGAVGGVVCVTCHTVHGTFSDAYAKTINTDLYHVNSNFLAIEQDPGTFNDGGRTIANGDGSVNFLCEGCHLGSQPDTVYNAAANDSAPANSADTPEARNPGGTAFGHPVDDMDVYGGINWVTSFPANWPSGQAFGGLKPDPGVICESCHAPHPLADTQTDANHAAARADLAVASATSMDYILRQQYSLVCGECHTAAVKEHHPTGIAFNSAGVTYLNVTGAADVLSCGTCHGGGTGAHNWPARAYVGLDPDWKPANNGRAAAGSVVTFERYRVDASLTCIECHVNADNNATNKSPTLHDGFNTNFSTADETAAAYPTRGGVADVNYTGTHALGRMGNIRLARTTPAAYWGSTVGLNAVRPDGTTAFNPETTSWAAAGFAGAHTDGISRFAGDGTATVAVLVCESCHELQPPRNADYHLLLANYFEDGVPDAANNRSRLCEGCHKPKGTHPQSSENVGRAGGDVLSTIPNDASSAGVRTWIIAPSGDPNVIMTQADPGIINCDTCHQPHDAPALSGSFIIDCAYTMLGVNGVGEGKATRTPATYGNFVATMLPTVYDGKGERHNKFCSQCHPY